MTLGKHINFIVGHNGSGKSAILTGIAICLGGKASGTQRGSRLSSFIKDGTSFSRVTVTIDNRDSNPYKKDQYGDKIIVERHIEKNSSSYKIYNEFKKTVSTRKDELESILHHYNIIVDNPMAILTQDAARTFITSDNKRTPIYQFLAQGMGHDVWKSKNKDAKINNDFTQQSLNSVKEEVESTKDSLRKLEGEYSTKIDEEKNQREFRRLKAKLAWMNVQQAEEELQDIKSTLQNEKKHLSELEVNMVNLENGVVDNEKKTRLDNSLLAVNEEIKVTKSLIQREQENFTTIKKDIQSAEQDQRQIEHQKFKTENNLKELRTKIESLRDTDQLGEAQTQQRAQIREFTEKSRTLEEKLANRQREILTVSSSLNTLQNKIDDSQTRVNQLNSAIQQDKTHIDEFTSVKDNELLAFGQNMPSVLDEIQRSRFQQQPIGPVGSYVTLKSHKWSRVLNQQLSATLRSFVVENERDRVTLMDILKRHNLSNSIIVTKRDIYDYESYMPDKQFTTILDVLDISDEFVKRVLIDQNHIESTILIENRKEAENLMFQKPKNVSQCYALLSNGDGTIVGGGSQSSSSSAPIYGWTRPSLMSSGGSDRQVESLKESLAVNVQERQALVRDQQSNLKQRNELDSRKKQLEQAVIQYKDRIRKLSVEIRQAEQKLDEDFDDRKAHRLETELNDLERELEKYKNQLTDSIVAISQFKDSLSNSQIRMGQYNDTFNEQTQRAKEFEEDLRNWNREKDNIKSVISQTRRNIEHAKRNVADTEQVLNTKQQEIDSAVSKATKLGHKEDEMVEGEHTLDLLIEKLTRLRQLIEVSRMSNERTLAVVTNDLKAAREKYKNLKLQYNNILSALNKLAAMQSSHELQYERFLRETTRSIQLEFDRILKERNFEGSLNIDHNAQNLELSAAPKSQSDQANGTQNHSKKKGRSTKTLSGGEKSFSQISFLLAVWKVMGCKIRGLDEFDVFMDEVNRKVSMKLMIEAVKASGRVQTIFITPNNMADMNINDDEVAIHLMSDPRR